MTKQKLAQTRAGQTRGRRSRSRRHRPPRERWDSYGKRHDHEEGGDLNRLWRTPVARRRSTQGRRCGGGADAQGETREGAGLCALRFAEISRRMYEVKRLGYRSSKGTRGTMLWKTASYAKMCVRLREC